MTMRDALPRLPAEGTANVLFESFRTQTAIRELMQGVIAGTGVSGEEYAILGVVEFFPDRTPTELAAALGIPPTSVSRQVASLLDKKLAKRRQPGGRPLVPAPHDREGQQGRADDRTADRRTRAGARRSRRPPARGDLGLAGLAGAGDQERTCYRSVLTSTIR